MIAPPVHEATADETERDDRGDLEREHPHVRVAVELVDDDADQDRDEDARDLRADREQRGDDQ